MSGLAKGPWQVRDDGKGDLWVADAAGRAVATIHGYDDEARAAASAIAAAPALLEALKSLHSYAASVWFDEATATDEEREIMRQTRIALNLATGAQP